MNKVEEFLLEEAVDDLILSCDKDGEYIYASDMMQKYADQQLILSGVSNSLNEYMPLLLKKGQKVIVTQNKTSHCYKTGDILRIIKPHYKYKDTWYCKKGWFGTRQALEDQEFYIC